MKKQKTTMQKTKQNSSHTFSLRAGIIISLFIIIIDQLVKYYTTLSSLGEQKIIIPNVLYLTHVLNTGISFGQFPGNNFVWAWIAIIIFGLLIYWYDMFQTTLSKIGYWFIIGGLVGNLIDRIFRGAVIDMFNVPWFAVFNIADAAISIAVVLLVWDEVREHINKRKK